MLIGAVAVGLGFLGLLHDQRHLLDRVVAQELIPRDVTLVLHAEDGLGGVVHHLLIQRGGGGYAVEAGVAAVKDVVLDAVVEIVYLAGAVLLTVDAQCSGIPLQHAGVPHQQRRRHQHEYAGDHAVQDIALARLGLLLGLADLLGVGNALCRQILTGLLFS